MPSASTYLSFLLACVALILLPGPGQAMTIARTLSGGFRAGAVTAFGLNVGTVVHALAAGFGLSGVLASSDTAFAVVKWLGAAYLLYLGIGMLFSRSEGAEASMTKAPKSRGSSAPLREAVLAGVLNPKVALFFLAFLPQFVDPAKGPVALQMFVLGLTMAVLDFGYELLLAWLTFRVGHGLARQPRWHRLQVRLTGFVLVALGIRLAMQQR